MAVTTILATLAHAVIFVIYAALALLFISGLITLWLFVWILNDIRKLLKRRRELRGLHQA